MNYIDLRSDTVTLPTDEMKKAMFSAELGDDVYAEDPTINKLQEKTAALFGKEAGLYVPSGSMSNQIALAINTDTGNEVIIENDAHVFYYETAAPSIISRVMLRTIPSKTGMMDIDDIKNAIRTSEYYLPKTKMICMENTHNRHCGAILDFNYLKEVKKIAIDNELTFHLDGARIWNACVATGIKPIEYGELFDTISVCLSKGMGAPVGSVLLGTKKDMEKALKWRKILGGGMRQAGILAAAGIYAIDNNFERLAEDHLNAKDFANLLQNIDGLKVDLAKVQTNMVFIDIDKSIKLSDFMESLKINGIKIGATGPNTLRAVFHLNISKEDALKSAEIIIDTIKKMLN